jgi:hypothetical protein
MGLGQAVEFLSCDHARKLNEFRPIWFFTLSHHKLEEVLNDNVRL